MFLAEKLPRSYVGLYQKLLYKSFIITDPPPPPNILITPPLMILQLYLGQLAQCYMLLQKLRPSVVVSAHLSNSLPTQILDNLCVTPQAQVTRRGL